MIIEGKKLAEDVFGRLKAQIEQFGRNPSLAVVVVGNDYATEKFIEIKKKYSDYIGISFQVHKFSEDISSEELIKEITTVIQDKTIDAVVIQLPLPKHIDMDTTLDHVPFRYDVDVLSRESIQRFEDNDIEILPPVIGAIKEIVDVNNIPIKKKNVLVVGKGRLVGAPALVWFKQQGANVTALDKSSVNIEDVFKNADIIVSGAGVPNMIKPDMIKEGVVIFDAGTSEAGGKLSGDADPTCASKCSFFTPVPGGIGILTVAKLLENVVIRSDRANL